MTEVAVVLGSDSDEPIAKKAYKILEENEVDYARKVISAHRNPEELKKFVNESDANVFIGIAGLSAALPGAIASHTDKPVIGVPVNAKLEGLDSLLSISQMPKGVPVACVGIDRADNAALLAIRILESN
ncbi:5-(carboxyamino)imidazole ribonucleotide mutase [archaeon SCG-AAA382B04]|nr:5-(carboxyamino)imidazole ribonucleotide mutase [archaeon SCG-AAA382B04]